MIRCVLFDLDGTLADTAPDLAGALNKMRADRGLEAMPLEPLRRMASSGARGLVGVGFGIKPGDAQYEQYKTEFLNNYQSALFVHSRLFDGIEALLGDLEKRDLAWGVVTNKASRFTDPLSQLMGFTGRAACVVSGDTTPHAKPHPAPLLHAAELCKVDPAACIYVGDDLRDIQAGRAAGMKTLAVTWGYMGDGEPVQQWGADAVIATPPEVLQHL
ncbi:MAG: phosphoglycolate phosphatase [Betaproteobacteria bacterium]|nr:phosphoglycolate phosphatase [Betaproteobacteria bacterium]